MERRLIHLSLIMPLCILIMTKIATSSAFLLESKRKSKTLGMVQGHDKTLLENLQQCWPDVTSYKVLKSVSQSNAEGILICTDTNTDLFVKTVYAEHYKQKTWPDLRRTLTYLRTEVRFYTELLPKLRGVNAPNCYMAECNLQGIIDDHERAVDVSNEEPSNLSKILQGKGGFMILEAMDPEKFVQQSPVTFDEASQCLKAVAKMHAAAWEDVDLLSMAANRLSRGAYHLQMRDPKELEGIEDAWANFMSNFREYQPALFAQPPIQELGKRVARVANRVSRELSPSPTDPHATLVHGDYKAMNVFLPVKGGDDAVMIDFSSIGVGIGMSDTVMHIYHALHPKDIDENALLDIYLQALKDSNNNINYTRNEALKHYRLSVIDYFRFFLGRFWKTATVESMLKKTNSENTSLINRNPDAAMAFVATVEHCLTEYEKELS